MEPGCGTIYYGTIYCGTFYYGTIYYGTFYYGTFCCGTIYYGTIYYGTIAFDPSPSVIFIVPKIAVIPLFYSLFLVSSLLCPTIFLVHCIKYRYLGFVRF